MTESERTGFLNYLAAIIDVHKNLEEQANSLRAIDAELRKSNPEVDELKRAVKGEEVNLKNLKAAQEAAQKAVKEAPNDQEVENEIIRFKDFDKDTREEIKWQSFKVSAIISGIALFVGGGLLIGVLQEHGIEGGADFGIVFGLALMSFAISMFIAIKIHVAIEADDLKEANKGYKENKAKQVLQYDKEISCSKSKLSTYKKRLAIAGAQERARVEYLRGLQETLTKIQQSSYDTYKKLLESDALPGKFKQMEYVVLVFDLLATRQTNELEGPTGAFRMASTDARLDTIINKLDTVINSLRDISWILTGMQEELRQLNQTVSLIGNDINRIYNSISEMNLHTAEMAQNAASMNQNAIHVITQLDNLEAKASLLAYQQERATREIEFANKLQYIKDGQYSRYLFDNRPPHMR